MKNGCTVAEANEEEIKVSLEIKGFFLEDWVDRNVHVWVK